MNCIHDRCRDLLVTSYLRLPEQGAMVINGDRCWSPTSPEGAQTRQRALTVATARLL